MQERATYPDRKSWLEGRQRGIGASEAAAIVGLSPWQTSMSLWQLKTGQVKAKELTGNPAVEQGNRTEPALRAMFGALHPEYRIEYHAFDMLYQSDTPWMYATLDGEIITSDGRKGILEIKTSTPNSKAGWEKWNGKVPNNYYVQILHQLYATGYDFAVLFAGLWGTSGDITLRTYEFDRAECESDIEWLKAKEQEFWKHVENRTLPPMALTL